MLKIAYSPYKGYYLPRNSKDLTASQTGQVVTNGFDRFDWDDDSEDESPDRDGFDLKSLTVSNEQMHELQNKQKKKSQGKKRKKRKNSPVDESYIASDISKVKALNNLHREIMSNFDKNIKYDDRLLQFFDISVYKEDIDNLKDDEWLNDNNISFVYEYLERFQIQKFGKLIQDSIILLRPSMVYLLANTPTPVGLKGVLPPLENSKFIFLPVNDSDDVEAVGAGSHWSLVVISMLDKKALIYDTLENANEKEARIAINKLEKYLNNGTKFQEIVIEKSPQQINGSDCGILVSQVTSYLLTKLFHIELTEDSHFIDFSLNQVSFSAVEGRIFVLKAILRLLKHR